MCILILWWGVSHFQHCFSCLHKLPSKKLFQKFKQIGICLRGNPDNSRQDYVVGKVRYIATLIKCCFNSL